MISAWRHPAKRHLLFCSASDDEDKQLLKGIVWDEVSDFDDEPSDNSLERRVQSLEERVKLLEEVLELKRC